MKVVFLDIDGVLNNVASAAEGIDILPEKVILVRRLCQVTGASIVLSSSWRILFDIEFLRDLLYHTGLRQRWAGDKPVSVIDVTPRLDSGPRGLEIQKWLSEHQVTDYVIIDDDSDMLEIQMVNFIKTDNNIGLSSRDVDRAIQILGVEE